MSDAKTDIKTVAKTAKKYTIRFMQKDIPDETIVGVHLRYNTESDAWNIYAANPEDASAPIYRIAIFPRHVIRTILIARA